MKLWKLAIPALALVLATACSNAEDIQENVDLQEQPVDGNIEEPADTNLDSDTPSSNDLNTEEPANDDLDSEEPANDDVNPEEPTTEENSQETTNGE